MLGEGNGLFHADENAVDGPVTASLSEDATREDAPLLSAADAPLAEAVGAGLSWWPFAVYLGMWVLLSGASAYLLRSASAAQPARWMPAYEPLVWTGAALAALGPVISVAVAIGSRHRLGPHAKGVFASSAIRGAVTAFFGAIIWLSTLYVLEALASGRSFG